MDRGASGRETTPRLRPPGQAWLRCHRTEMESCPHLPARRLRASSANQAGEDEPARRPRAQSSRRPPRGPSNSDPQRSRLEHSTPGERRRHATLCLAPRDVPGASIQTSRGMFEPHVAFGMAVNAPLPASWPRRRSTRRIGGNAHVAYPGRCEDGINGPCPGGRVREEREVN